MFPYIDFSGGNILCIKRTFAYARACMCVCVRVYENSHNRAVRLNHPCHSMPLALFLPRGNQRCLLRKPLIGRVCVCVFIKLLITA